MDISIDHVTEPHASGEIDANFTTKYSYNALGKVTAVTYPDGTKVLLNYDPATNKVTIIDESDKTVLIEEYNWADQLVEATVKNVTLEGTPADQIWTFSYDSLGRKLAEKHPLEGVTNYVYDYLGRLTQKRLPAADVLLPGQESITTGFVPTQSYGYDDRGNKVWECGPNSHVLSDSTYMPIELHKVKYVYDSLNRLRTATEAVVGGSGASARITSIEYDLAGNKESVTDD
jgi:YD repeat-containing protein